MKKVIFGIFAHPDDEAFGPAGTLLMEKKAGNDVHLICVTAGESGVNPDGHANLADARLEEWKQAGALIGADSMHHLGFRDGRLCNNDYFEVASRLEAIIDELTRDADDIEIELMSLDHNGVTGHIDHVFVGRVAAYVYYRMKQTDTRLTRLRLACVPFAHAPEPTTDWLYMDAGRRPDEVGEVVDAREHIDTIYKIMRSHHSQRSDCETHIAAHGENVAVNHFLVLT